MHGLLESRDETSRSHTSVTSRLGVSASRVALGIVFLWFGVVKLFPGVSPAEALAGNTLHILSGGIVDPWYAVRALGAWEALIGLSLLTGLGMRVALLSLFVHLAGTMSPAVLTPDVVFARPPFVLTLEGQYIVKNVVLIAAGLVVAFGHGPAPCAEPAPTRPVAPQARASRSRALLAVGGDGVSLHD